MEDCHTFRTCAGFDPPCPKGKIRAGPLFFNSCVLMAIIGAIIYIAHKVGLAEVSDSCAKPRFLQYVCAFCSSQVEAEPGVMEHGIRLLEQLHSR